MAVMAVTVSGKILAPICLYAIVLALELMVDCGLE
jgi:predicted Co/Zn/Cd cation transporter (cation efflux family)